MLFSGGKDSFITACRVAGNGDRPVLISFNSGGMVAEENLLHGVTRLKARYCGVEYAGVYPTVSIARRLEEYWTNASAAELGEKYPNLTYCQARCLHCQTAMWVAAIAYARAKNIKAIAAGYRKNDIFCTGDNRYRELMEIVAGNNRISLDFPVWDLYKNDTERNLWMARNGFEPAVLEPKCLLGTPTRNGFPQQERDDMIHYTEEKLAHRMQAMIEGLGPMFKVLRLSETSFPIPKVDLSHIDEGGVFQPGGSPLAFLIVPGTINRDDFGVAGNSKHGWAGSMADIIVASNQDITKSPLMWYKKS